MYDAIVVEQWTVIDVSAEAFLFMSYTPVEIEVCVVNSSEAVLQAPGTSTAHYIHCRSSHVMSVLWHLTIQSRSYMAQPCLEHKSPSTACASCVEVCHSDFVPFHPHPLSSANSSQQTQGQIWLISVYGTCVVVTCLISRQALICPPISVSPQDKFQVRNWFLSGVFSLASIYMLVHLYLSVHVAICAYIHCGWLHFVSLCLPMLSQ